LLLLERSIGLRSNGDTPDQPSSGALRRQDTLAAAAAAQDPADPEIAFAEALDRKLGDCIFGNSAVGMSNDAIMLLQRPNDDQHLSGWADWGDYDALVPRLRQALADSGRRLVVDVFFAESDAMIGNPGAAGPGGSGPAA
jgi:hypothetical protein